MQKIDMACCQPLHLLPGEKVQRESDDELMQAPCRWSNGVVVLLEWKRTRLRDAAVFDFWYLDISGVPSFLSTAVAKFQ